MMKTINELEEALVKPVAGVVKDMDRDIILYAKMVAEIENAIVVVSDMIQKRSRIFSGKFGRVLGVDSYDCEDSIWEKMILSYLSEEELEAKLISELRFFHYLKGKPKSRSSYYLLTKLRFQILHGKMIDVVHKLHYIYESGNVRYAICRYEPLSCDFNGRSMVVNSIDGSMEELAVRGENGILSRRERQVLGLIAEGKKSAEIAEILSLSIHTVSRHRQEILAKLKVKNSIDACRLARTIGLI